MNLNKSNAVYESECDSNCGDSIWGTDSNCEESCDCVSKHSVSNHSVSNHSVSNIGFKLDECAICMDDIDAVKNRLTTECGHVFHTSCLMKNAAINGFGCPMCRTVMAEDPNDSDDDESTNVDDEDELYTDHSLRGMRWMFQSVQGEEVDDDSDSDDGDEEPHIDVPTFEHVMEHIQLHNITIDRLVKAILSSNYDEYSQFDEDADSIFHLMDTYIIDYHETVQPPVVASTVASTVEPVFDVESIESQYIFPSDPSDPSEFDSDEMIILPDTRPVILPYDHLAEADSMDKYYIMVKEVNAKLETERLNKTRELELMSREDCSLRDKVSHVSTKSRTKRISETRQETRQYIDSLPTCDNSMNHIEAVDSWFV
jgi:hypothetical protein